MSTVPERNYVFTSPSFFLLDPTPPLSFVSVDLDGHAGLGIPVFSNEIAADEYLAANPQPPTVIKLGVPDRGTFAATLSILADQKKYTHLIFDDRERGPGPKRRIAIKDLVEDFG